MRSLDTGKTNTWCPACGNFGILNAVKNAFNSLFDSGLDPAYLAITCGIGCHGKIFDYLNISGIYGLHGRAIATATGLKLANPDLKVVTFGGDGDSLGEGLEHTLFAAKRNIDLTLILHNNGNYGLTTGQFSPLSPQGYKGLSSPFGSVEEPFQAMPLLMISGASFAARAYSANPKHLAMILEQAIEHKGFSFIEVLQPCVSYNNTYKVYNEKVRYLENVPNNTLEAFTRAQDTDNLWLGVFRRELRDTYETILPGSINPVRNRLSKIQRIELLKKHNIL